MFDIDNIIDVYVSQEKSPGINAPSSGFLSSQLR